MSDAFKPFLAKALGADGLSEAEAEQAFALIMDGAVAEAQIGGFLMALQVRGETVAEITGAARVMRARALSIAAPEGAIDVCGTGGDGAGSYNISSAVAFVVAGCGVPVAKHGNRAASSRSGAADVLEALGVNIEADAPLVESALRDIGIGFLMAPRHHAAMRHVAPTRKALGVRTIFNILGPLANPAGTKRQLIGVFDARWTEPMAKVLQRLGAEAAWVVHGSDGLDELTTTGPSQVAALAAGMIRNFAVDPVALGLPLATPDQLAGGDPAHNAAALTALLEGQPGPYRDIVLLNAAAALCVAGKVDGLADGLTLAARSIDQGKARDCLDRLIAQTR